MINTDLTSEKVYNLGRIRSILGTASYSQDKKYRYVLTRRWSSGQRICCFVMMNPSTATEEKLDPTVYKCLWWAIAWGFDELRVVNLFAYRSTDVKQIYKVEDPIGVDNDKHIEETFKMCKDGLVVVAYGTNGLYKNRNSKINELADIAGVNLYCLKLTTKTNVPQHPLYLPKNTTPILWRSL